MAGKQTLWDQLLTGTCNAVADIREKLVEEPWFGRDLDVPVSELAPGREQKTGQEQEVTTPKGPGLDR